jgi:hypothetical protein
VHAEVKKIQNADCLVEKRVNMIANPLGADAPLPLPRLLCLSITSAIVPRRFSYVVQLGHAKCQPPFSLLCFLASGRPRAPRATKEKSAAIWACMSTPATFAPIVETRKSPACMCEPRRGTGNLLTDNTWQSPHVRKRKRVDSSSQDVQATVEPKAVHIPSLDHESPETPSKQASYLGRSEYIAAHADIDEDDATHYQSPGFNSRTGSWHNFESKVRRNASSLELPTGTLRQTYLRNFLLRCRPWMPLISESDLASVDAKTGDTLLVTAMLVAGTIVSSTAHAAEQGQRCYQRAKLLFYTNAEQNHLHTIMATIFLQWLNPSGPEHVSIDSSSFWLRISVALAHQTGLHREPDPRMTEAKLRRRIWWTLVVGDSYPTWFLVLRRPSRETTK